MSPVTVRLIEEYRVREHLLSDHLIRPLAIVDLGELEILEALASQGYQLLAVLNEWKASPLAELSLRNYLVERFPARPEFLRPARMRPHMDRVFADVLARLGFAPQQTDAAHPDPAG